MAAKETAPARSGQEQNTKAPALLDIEALRAKHNISRAVFAGVCGAMAWRPGKAVTEEEFLAAVNAFNTAPMDGAAAGKEAGA